MSITADPYLWLEDIENPKVREWALKRSRESRRRLEDFSQKLLNRILEYYRVPYVVLAQLTRKGIYMLVRSYDSYSIYRLNPDGSREEILSSHSLGKDIVIKWISANRDGDRLVFSFSRGSDEGITRIVNPDTGDLIDELHGVVGGFTWIDRDRYYYTRFYRREKTPDGVDPPAERVFLRENGVDEMVFGEGLPSLYMIDIFDDTSSSKALITVSIGWSRSTVYAGDLRDPSTWRELYGDGEHRFYPINYISGKYYILGFDGNGMGRIIAVEDSGKVREIVGEDEKYPLRYAVTTFARIVAHYLVNASSRIRIYDLDGRLAKEVEFYPPGRVSGISCLEEECIVRYESFYIPYRLYMLEDDGLEVIDSQELPVEGLSVSELWVRSFDNTPIHVFKVYNRARERRKALLYGYGGFNIPLTPRYMPYIIPFIEDGGSFFVANIRGGGEYGEKWHRAGMKENKENVFRDFIAVAEHLWREGFEVVVIGSSNGGLLAAVTLTRIPDILKGAVIGYPVLDMLRFHKLYIGRLWTTEYGDPENPREREYLLKYSPYHNVKPGVNYPPVMIYTGLYDDRVHPGHALKFAAKLEEIGVQCYLRVETSSGHSGANPLIKAAEGADILAFVYKVLGMKP